MASILVIPGLLFATQFGLASHQAGLYPVIEIQPLPPTPHVHMPDLPTKDVQVLISQALQALDHRHHVFEPGIFNKGVTLTPDTPAWFMAVSRTGFPGARNLSHMAMVAEEGTKYINSLYGLSREQICYGLTQVDLRDSPLGSLCPLHVDYPCQPKKYRAYSGYCNNVQNPRWGNANTRLLRYLPADYADNISLPRGGGLQNNTLPSAREVSLVAHGDADTPHKHLMAISAVWGEFISHDLAHVPQVSGYDGTRLKCCGVNFADFHPECFPIRLPDNDPVHSKLGERCQDYARSATAPRTGCTFGPREQINQATSFLDASAVYGSHKSEVDALREFSGGRLKSQRGRVGKPLLPPELNVGECRHHPSQKCFKSGDVRVNEHLGLATLHTLWMREHNRLVGELEVLNPHWSDETLFQEARRLVSAEIQHITYNEYLPMILGQDTMDSYGLNLQPFDFYTGYDININAGVSNVVAVGALNFISSLIPKSVDVFDRHGRKIDAQDISSTFFAPFSLYEAEGFDKMMQGLLHGAAQTEDNHINEVMTNHMFQSSSSRGGLDLAAQIIQQGRDHGISGYTKWRQFCNLPHVRSFSDLRGVMGSEVITALQGVYRNVSDVDLFTGALAETPMLGAVVGPTLACLLGRQFHYLRRGDRYWYENDLPPSSFTKEQLHEIRKVTFSRIVCDNADDIKLVQPQVFLDQDPFLNAMMDCQHGAMKSMSLEPWRTNHKSVYVPQKLLSDAVNRAKKDVEKLLLREHDLFVNKRTADPLSPVGTAFGFSRPKRQALEIANTSLVLQFMSSRFVNSFLQGQLQDDEENIGNGIQARDLQDLMDALPNVDISDVLEIPRVFSCDDQTLPCDHTNKYRTITGWCNNLITPGRGKSLRAFSRLLPPKYDDGVGSPKFKSVDGRPLPSPRLVSISTHPDTSRPHVRYSLMFMQLAQLVDHDLTHTPVNRAFVGDAILDCRPCDAMTSVHPECIPISIPEGDPYFPKVNITTGQPLCIPVTRSMPGQLTLGYREQLNQVTAYVDASFVYGSDVCESKVLRAFSRGRMNVTNASQHRKPLLPQISTHPECKSVSKVCFRGGDARASEQPALTAIHTVYLREHNRIADELHKLNPHWDDETIYQQTRRVMSAATQHMTYGELLPRILGWDANHKYGLTLQSEGYYKGYNPNCDATIVNEFSSAAFRFGHSLLKPALLRYDNDYKARQPEVRLRDTFFNPEVIYQTNMVDELLRGLSITPMETLDQFITNEVTNHLFEDRSRPYSGMDLAAINIQRGRDHGIRSYNEYRVICNLTRARSFDDLKREIPSPVVESLRRIYSHVDDIDLFPGGLSETPLVGGVVGPTFSCIIGEQFQRLRNCDRFWYENEDSLVRFTEEQLMEIRKVTLAKVICDNSDLMPAIQRHVLDLPDPFLNPIVPCQNLPSINLDAWKERHSCTVKEATIAVGSSTRVTPCVTCSCTKEGPKCQSLRIANCFHLAKSFPRESLLSDHVCKVQCAYVLRALPRVFDIEHSSLGFT